MHESEQAPIFFTLKMIMMEVLQTEMSEALQPQRSLAAFTPSTLLGRLHVYPVLCEQSGEGGRGWREMSHSIVHRFWRRV